MTGDLIVAAPWLVFAAGLAVIGWRLAAVTAAGSAIGRDPARTTPPGPGPARRAGAGLVSIMLCGCRPVILAGRWCRCSAMQAGLLTAQAAPGRPAATGPAGAAGRGGQCVPAVTQSPSERVSWADAADRPGHLTGHGWPRPGICAQGRYAAVFAALFALVPGLTGPAG